MSDQASQIDNWNWLLQPLLQVAGIAIVAAGSWAIGRVAQWLGLKNKQQITNALDAALQKSVTWGLQQVQGQISANGWDDVTVKSQALQYAFTYMKANFAGTIAAAVTKDQTDVDAAVRGALDRAFPAAAAAAAASPGTPPATAPHPAAMRDVPPQPK